MRQENLEKRVDDLKRAPQEHNMRVAATREAFLGVDD